MKKILAAAVAAALCTVMLSGCEKAAEDVSGTTYSETVSESETEITENSETTANTAAETSENFSQTTAKASAEQNAPENFPVGKWIETRSYIYDFWENGNVTVDTGFYKLAGSYEYDGNSIKLIFNDSSDTPNEFNFDVDFEENYARLKSTDYTNFTNGTEYICIPYDPVGLATGNRDIAADTNEYRLTPYSGGLTDVTVNDFQGAWQKYYSDDQPADDIFLYCGDINVSLGSNIKYKIETDENGYSPIDEDTWFLIEKGNGSHDWVYYQRSFKMYGDILFICDNYEDTLIYKRFKSENVPENFFDGSFAVHGFLKGEFSNLKNGIGQFTGTDGIVYDTELNIKDNKLYVTIDGETTSYEYYFRKKSDDKYTMSFLNVTALENDEDVFWSYIEK